MKEIKIFFVDLDGTLLDEVIDGRKCVSEKNKMMIKKAESENIHVIINTGRTGEKPFEYLKEAGVKYAVMGNGSQVINEKGETIYMKKMSPDIVKKVIDFCINNKIAIKMDIARIAYGINRKPLYYIPEKQNYKIVKDYQGITTDLEIQKIIVWADDPEANDQLMKKIEKELPEVSVVGSERGWTVEITHKEATKGLGSKYFYENIIKCEKEYTAHIGDTLNDLPAIKHVGHFIAMGDSEEKLLKESPYIGPDHKDHGVGQVILGNWKENPLYEKK